MKRVEWIGLGLQQCIDNGLYLVVMGEETYGLDGGEVEWSGVGFGFRLGFGFGIVCRQGQRTAHRLKIVHTRTYVPVGHLCNAFKRCV